MDDDLSRMLAGCHAGGRGNVRCPACLGDESHVREAYTRTGSDAHEAVVYPGTEARGSTGSRRSALVVVFDGECGHSWELVIRQHKGVNYLDVARLEGRRDGPEPDGEDEPYWSVVDYCRLIGRDIEEREAARHGKGLTRLCKELGVEVRRVPDSRWGRVNAYPEGLLRDLLGGGPAGAGGGLRLESFPGRREVGRLTRQRR